MLLKENPYYWQGTLVRLRPMRLDDAGLWLAEQQSDSEAVRYLNTGMALPASETAARRFVEKYAEFKNSDQLLMFSIENLDGQLVGNINIHSADQKNGTFETGSRIFQAHRRRGYFFDAKLIILRYAFHELRYQKYYIFCMEGNEPMIRHAARLGCKSEGRLRRHIYTNGRFYDELVFGLTREEFDELLEKMDTESAEKTQRTQR
ncbi:MAG: GNAT family N-acetyltransferase [Candidatus Promineifilaceae bacterium]|jgi:RimJ/RimL family protein N-acetyltransferase